MEASVLLTIGGIRGIRTGCLANVDNYIFEREVSGTYAPHRDVVMQGTMRMIEVCAVCVCACALCICIFDNYIFERKSRARTRRTATWSCRALLCAQCACMYDYHIAVSVKTLAPFER